jgi:dTDP-glucose 4,6-dehydratase
MRSTLVTGGAGFIGCHFVRRLLAAGQHVVTLDKLTYAGNLDSLSDVLDNPQHVFVRGDIADVDLVTSLLHKHRPRAIVNLAAETHVDRSIDSPEPFVQTNVVGTARLLDAVRNYWQTLSADEKFEFRFLHVSTDEVYGSVAEPEQSSEEAMLAPNSPYAASKAAADHLVRAYHRTYGLPTLTTRCSNNYGPFQFPEKLIPLMILAAASGRTLPLYGDGQQVRDWLHVSDHCAGLLAVLERGRPGEVYNLGGDCNRTNCEIVHAICRIVDELRPSAVAAAQRIERVADRPGHDRRYALAADKAHRDLDWRPQVEIEAGLRETVVWYLANQTWVERITSGKYRGERLGLAAAALTAESSAVTP